MFSCSSDSSENTVINNTEPNSEKVDFESLEDKKVTVRDRDSMEQERISIEDLKNYLQSKFNS